VRRGLTNGELAVGDALPSVRALADRLVVNHNTVAKAYNELARDGVIESHQGRGVFIAKRRNIYTRAERTRRLEAALDAFVGEVVTLDFRPDEIRDALEKKLSALNGKNQPKT
jgi:GntR family transcriptional regulator